MKKFITQKNINYAVVTICILGIALFAGSILHAALSAFYSRNFLMSDYGVYTNTIWNLSHFNGFAFLIDHSYLKTHLSFSLALLAPLFWIFDSPLTLLVAQWLMMIAGAAILVRLARRCNIPYVLSLPVAFLFIAYPFMQSIMLSEFHGVSLYLILIPWLIYCLETKKKLAIIPFVMILGLREDAGFMLPLIFIYYAVRDRWRGGYIFAASAVIYSCLAVFVLYPWITGESLLAIRSSEATASSILNRWNPEDLINRLQATGWILLMALPVLILNFRKSLPLLIFPLLPYIFSMLSGFQRQHSMQFHYPAIIMATLIPAIIVSLKYMPKQIKRSTALSIFIIAVTVGAHLSYGFVLKAPRTHAVYRRINPEGKYILEAASHINKDGVLVCNQKLAVFCANRENISTWRYWNKDKHQADSFFMMYDELLNNRKVIELIANGVFGVKYFHLPFIVVERGFDVAKNKELLGFIEHPVVIAAYTSLHVGHNVHINDKPYRHWLGSGDDGAQTLLYGRGVILPAGKYKATFTYRTQREKEVEHSSCGKFSVHVMNQQAHLAESEIVRDAMGEFVTQDIEFEIDTETKIEPRVITGYAELWISRISFETQIKGERGERNDEDGSKRKNGAL